MSALLFSGAVHATTELPTPYDARAVGMGGTGIAHVHDGASVYHNPAALHEVKQFAATVTLAPTLTGQSAPVDGPQTTRAADAGVLPLFLLGAAYRVHPRLVLGAAVYPTGGFGATYKDVAAFGGLSLKGRVAISELSAVATYSILDNLAVALGYRLTVVSQSMTLPVAPPAGGPPVEAESDLSGAGWLGVQAGIYFRPISRLRLGAVYRSKVTTKLTGSTTMSGATLDSSTELTCPHGFKLGAAFAAIPNRLLLALDFKYLLYGNASQALVTKTETPAGQAVTTQRLDWKDAFSGYFGGELLVTPRIPVRLGYLFTTSATPASRPSPLLMAPGIVHGPTVGLGLRLAQLALDVGAGYSWGGKTVGASVLAPDAGVAPGRYETRTLVLAVSATYVRD